MQDCEVKGNCKTFETGQCWHCEDYALYMPIDKRILCQRQIRNREERKALKAEKKSSEASRRGKRAKRKGYEGENEIVHLLRKYGITAERVPLSGALKGKLAGDINCTIHDREKKIESKRRADGFKELYKYLEQDDCSYVFMRADRKDWIVAMPFKEWLELAGGDKGEGTG